MSFIDLYLQLIMQWQQLLVDLVIENRLLPNSDALILLSNLDDFTSETVWFKNMDLSINGHITDTSLWIKLILDDLGQDKLPSESAYNLA